MVTVPRGFDISISSSAREYVIAAWSVAVLGTLLSLGAFWFIQQELDAHKLLEFQWVAENRHRALNKEIVNELKAVESIRDFFLVSGQVTREEFEALARTLLERYRGIRTLGWIPCVSDPERRTLESDDASLDRDRIMAGHPRFGPGPAGQREVDFPALFIESDAGNEPLSGLDDASSPLYQDLLDRARESGEMVVSRRIGLEREGRFGFAAFLPIHGNDGMAVRQEMARGCLLGFALGIFRIGKLATAATSVLEPRGVEFLILDESAPVGERYLDFYPSRLSLPGLSSPEGWQAWQRRTEPRLTQVFQVADREWSVTSAPTAEYRSAGGFQQGPWVVLASGLTVTVLLTLYLLRVEQSERVRGKMEAVLREREELFRQMTEAIQEIFWIQTPDGSRVLYVSPAYEKIWGRSCDSLYQRPRSFLDNIHPEDRGDVASTFGRIPDEGSEQVFRVLRPDGSTRWVRSRAFAVYNEMGQVYRIAGIREDITEIEQAEQALRKSEKQLRSLFDQSPDVIKIVDHSGRILSMSRSLPGLPVGEAIGRNSIALVPPEYRKRYRKGLEKAFHNGGIVHFQYATPDAAWWDVRIVPIRREGGTREAMVIVADVTETKDLEAKSIRSARLASLGVLAAGVAHEINNPNNAIQFNASVLARVLEDSLPIIERYRKENGDFVLGGMAVDKALETVPRILDGIRSSSLRIQRIVGNLKHMSRHDKGDLSQDIDVLEVIQAAVSILRDQIDKRTDRFVLDLADSLPAIKGNAQELEQVFINIIMNALQALTEHSQQVKVSTSLDDAGRAILVVVSDEGCGIPEDRIRKVTQPFFTTREESGGTGLGMSISDTIVRRHEGKLELWSALGVGTRVSVRLPVSPASDEAA